jgi:hypothetical protein
MDWAWFLAALGFLAVMLSLFLLHAELRRIGGLLDSHLELHDRRERLYEDEQRLSR